MPYFLSVCVFVAIHSLCTVDLLGLLKWRQQPDRLEENLKGLMRVSGEEIVKVNPTLHVL